MTIFKNFSGLGIILALGACANAPSPEAVGIAANNAAAGTYSVTMNGTTTDLGVPTGSLIGGLKYYDNASTYAALIQNSSALAIAGFSKTTGDPIAGISGTTGTIPTTGTAVYNGFATMLFQATPGVFTSTTDVLALNVDYGAATISQAGTLAIDGTISGTSITGTATMSGYTSPLVGGFYGSNTVAGAFAGGNLTGTFLGTKP